MLIKLSELEFEFTYQNKSYFHQIKEIYADKNEKSLNILIIY